MTRIGPTLLAFVAAILLIAPPTVVVHAHGGGHDTHAHGPRSVLHVPLVDHAHPHSHRHGHSHSHGPVDSPDEPRDLPPEQGPERHLHVDGDLEGLNRSGTPTELPANESRGASVAEVVPSLDGDACRSGALPVPRKRAYAPRPPARSTDRLVRAGSLLL